ncbi:MAG TPA: RHS repeat-associated core domain-containing protein [Anaerohalosphaeraceae bacterium]|nr:RHS repeat-associated core domain-containing protein [Anaerohalosphaeraceae bacterium]
MVTGTTTTTTRYYYDDQRIAMQVETVGESQTERLFVYGNYIDEVLMMIVPGATSTTDYYYAHDHLYSPVVLFGLDDQQEWAPLERYEYDVYGKVRIFGQGADEIYFTVDDESRMVSAYGNPYVFTGREMDSVDSGSCKLYYYRARCYNPQTGRFLQRDPLRYVDGMNLYEYVGSNSVLTGDPFGLSADIDKCIDKCLTLRSGDGREECLNRCKRRTNENFVLPSFGSVVDNLLAAAIVSNGTSSKSPPIKTPYGEITFSFGAKVETKPCCSDGRKGVLIGASVSVSGKICIGVGGGITKNTLVKNFVAVFDPLQKGDLPCKGSDSGKVTVELSGQAGAIVTGSASVETVILPPSQAWEQNYDVRIDIGLWAGAEVCLGVEGTYKKIRVLN